MNARRSQSDALVSIRSLAFAYSDQAVLRGLDLDLAPAEVTALLGPNGAGKSTLVRCLVGRLRPDSGTITIDGGDPLAERAVRARIGLVPQSIALYGHLTVDENLAVFARLAGVPRAGLDSRVKHTLARCALDPVARTRADRLSGGWQRRANIACALVHEPKLLILDEPTVGIDPPAREHIEALVGSYAQSGAAVLLVSHELDALERLADRVAFLDRGRVALCGPPGDLLAARFGELRECRLELDEHAEMPSLEGLQPVVGRPGCHAGLLPAAHARRLGERLAGLAAVAEWRVRRPSLATLWRELYRSAPGAGS